MKMIIKTLITFALVAASLACNAQLNVNPVIASSGTNYVAPATTNAFYSSLPVIINTRANAMAIACTGLLTINTNSTIAFVFDTSLDQSRWESNTTTVTLTCSTTNATTVISKVALGGVPYYRLSSIANTNSVGTFTNINVYVVTKNGI